MNTNQKYFFRFMYLILCFLMVILATYGYIRISNNSKNNKVEEKNVYIATKSNDISYEEQKDEDTQEVVLESSYENFMLYKKVYYTVCGHVTEQPVILSRAPKSYSQEEIMKDYEGWVIEDYQDNRVDISKQVNKRCPNHYILKEHDGRIEVIYQEAQDGNDTKETTNIFVENLSQSDQEQLSKGIIVDSNEKLAELLEDFGS